MESVVEVAKYILSKDPDGEMFKLEDLSDKNNATMYSGNLRLNKYLHIAQNLHLAKYGTKLFKEKLYAYKNGGVVKEVQTNYQPLRKASFVERNFHLSAQSMHFIDQVCKLLKNADDDYLVEVSHEDPEWQIKRNNGYSHASQEMNSQEFVEIYKDKYAAALKVMDRM